jgi:hypothetical protein
VDYWDRCAAANGVALVVLVAGSLVAWFLLVAAPWYAHAGAVVAILMVCWVLEDRLLSRLINTWMRRPGDPE